MTNVEKFILENWGNTIRTCEKDDGTLIALPKPFTIPTMRDHFQEMYYWDTYFTNVGLFLSDLGEQAKNNTENVAYMIDKYGFMPNGNRTYFLNRSQPPYFTLMVRDVYEQTKDKQWLEKMYFTGCKEHDFWENNRKTTCGLNRYHGITLKEDYKTKASQFSRRIQEECPESEEECKKLAEISVSFCESGWDLNSRYGMRPHEHAGIDLNSLLYGMEENLAFFADELGFEHNWRQIAEERKALINKLCWNEKRGIFCDYDFVNEKVCDFFSWAAFYPLFTGLATKEQAESTIKQLHLLEYDYGVACCENREDLLDFQWDYPFGWAPEHYVIMNSLKRYGHENDAKRVAKKYCDLVERNFETTKNLWEKYNVTTGTVTKDREHSQFDNVPTMMGWSAGIYLYALTQK